MQKVSHTAKGVPLTGCYTVKYTICASDIADSFNCIFPPPKPIFYCILLYLVVVIYFILTYFHLHIRIYLLNVYLLNVLEKIKNINKTIPEIHNYFIIDNYRCSPYINYKV